MSSNFVQVGPSNVPIRAICVSNGGGGTASRLFNYSTTAGVSLGTFAAIAGRDLGALVPGWSTDVEDAITEALLQGRRIRTTINIQTEYVKTVAEAVSSTDLTIDLYTGNGRFLLRHQYFLSVDGLSTVTQGYYQGEVAAELDSGDVTYKESAIICSLQQQITPPDAPTQYISLLNTVCDPAPDTDNTDGKITVSGITANNCELSSALTLKCLTIDIIS